MKKHSFSVADVRGHEGRPLGSKFFQFHAVFGKILQNRMLAAPSPGELAPQPQGNPGSATAFNECGDIFIKQFSSHKPLCDGILYCCLGPD